MPRFPSTSSLSTAFAVAVLLFVARAGAQPCVECWNKSCPELKSYKPPCTEGGHGHAGHKGPDKATVEDAHGCPSGQAQSSDTAGHCCWPGQVFAEGRCRGVPTSCPATHEIDARGEACRVPACASGQVRAKDGIHCCWSGQVWATQRERCVGVPSKCPQGFRADVGAETCEPIPCGERQVRASPGAPCTDCPGQYMVPNSDGNACVLRCTGELIADREHNTCKPCPEGTRPDGQNASCEKAPCAPGTARLADSTACRPCKSGFEPARDRESCQPLPCPEGQARTDEGECVVDPVQAAAQAERRRLERERQEREEAEARRREAQERYQSQMSAYNAAVERGAVMRKAGGALVGIAAAFAVGSVVFAYLGGQQNSNILAGGYAKSKDIASAADTGQTYNNACIGMGIVGGVAAAVGVPLLVLGRKPKEPRRPRELEMSFGPGPGYGLSLVGTLP
jgi:hypothetical protein